MRQRTYVENGGFRAYRKNNPDKFKIYSGRHKDHDINKHEWDSCKQYFNYECAYCGMAEQEAKERYNNFLHKEHVDCNGNSDLSNCVPACKQCNSEKHTFELDDWYREENDKYSIDRYNKIIKWLQSDHKNYIK